MNLSDASQSLRWQAHMGVDETLDDAPIDRTKVVAKAVPSKNVSVNIQTTQKSAHNSPSEPPKKAGFSEPKADFKPITAVDLPSAQGLVDQARHIADDVKNLDELREGVRSFDGLSIQKTAMNMVFADGNPDADIMFIGEAPGANEDEQGIPFCGESGQLMDKACAHVGLFREKNWYITNTVFWRPPGNRKPTKDENAICKPFVEKHIALQAPKLIVLVGGTATSTLMDSSTGITKLHGTFTEYTNAYLDSPIPMSAVYHPSFLLRSPSKKKDFWFDLLKIRAFCQENAISL